MVRASQARLLIVGDGPERQTLNRLAAELGGTTSIAFLGPTHDVRRHFAAADVVVLPSRSEGISNTLLEAMACETAVIATDVGGNRHVIRNPEIGRLVRSDDPHALASGIEELLRNAALRSRLGACAREHVLANYTAAIMIDAYAALYDRLTCSSWSHTRVGAAG
jgi:glycosyltransferase involved in cell wall biosynthesis